MEDGEKLVKVVVRTTEERRTAWRRRRPGAA